MDWEEIVAMLTALAAEPGLGAAGEVLAVAERTFGDRLDRPPASSSSSCSTMPAIRSSRVSGRLPDDRSGEAGDGAPLLADRDLVGLVGFEERGEGDVDEGRDDLGEGLGALAVDVVVEQ